MKNKKGFTLIELLAVIIILGVLMATAVVGVTRLIQDSRKGTYVNTASSYVSGVSPKVNAGHFPVHEVGTLYLLPVGHDETISCVDLEKGGVSPFHKEWEYAYVGAVYDNNDRDYYFVSKDKANHAINFATDKALLDQGGKLVVTGSDVVQVPELATNYGTGKVFFVGTGTPPTGTENASAELKAIAASITKTPISLVEFVSTTACRA